MKLTLTQQETILAIQYYLVNAKNMQVDKVDIQYENFTEIKTQTETKDQNPWLVPDEEGWFTHDPGWKNEEPPTYIDSNKDVIVEFRKYGVDDSVVKASQWDWSVDGSTADIIKWKYTD